MCRIVGASTLVAVTLAVPLPSRAESVAVECPQYAEAVLRAKAALVAGNRSAAIDQLTRAKAELKACTLRAEAEQTISG